MSCRGQRGPGSAFSLSPVRAYLFEQLFQLPAPRERGRLVPTTDAVSIDKDARHGARARDRRQVVLYVVHIVAVFNLQDLKLAGQAAQGRLGLGAERAGGSRTPFIIRYDKQDETRYHANILAAKKNCFTSSSWRTPSRGAFAPNRPPDPLMMSLRFPC